MKRIVRGNDFTLRIPVKKIVNGEHVSFPLTDCTDITVRIVSQYKRTALHYTIDKESNDVLLADVDGTALSLGTYALEVTGKFEDANWRSYEYEQFAIVDNNASGDIVFDDSTAEGDNNLGDTGGNTDANPTTKGCMDVTIESFAVDAALVVLPPVSSRATIIELIAKADAAIVEMQNIEAKVKANENERVKTEALRQSTEQQRTEAETTRQTAETARKAAEAERVTADAEREKRVFEAISNVDSAIQAANDAANTATTAAAEAEMVNVTLENSVISVTDRKGVTKTVDVVNTDEKVNVTITSSVSAINVSGVKINVFINNGKTPQTYTTNGEGKVSFIVNRGNYYQITFTEYGKAQPIAPVGYTAMLATRNVDVEYKPYDEASMENVVVAVTKHTDGTGVAFEGVPVVVTVDKNSTTYNTDAKGQVSVYVPYGKGFTVNVDNIDGYYVSFGRNARTYTASVPKRIIDYQMYQFRAGIFIVDSNFNDYYLEEWKAAGKKAAEAVAIKIADSTLMQNRGAFMIRTSDLLAIKTIPRKKWCTQNVQFYSITLYGNDTKDVNFYNGEASSFLVRQEAAERFLSIPAFDYAYEQIFSIAGHELHGFLMSTGQETIHIANVLIIKHILAALYGEETANTYYNFVMNKERWASTQHSVTEARYYSFRSGFYNKTSPAHVLPVFAC